jgi:NAD(P)H dehydrogenase (quinone)
MNVLVLHAHPVGTSFGAALHQKTITGLELAGHQVDDCNLYVEGFDPVMSRRDRLGYYLVPDNRRPVDEYVQRLEAADGLVIVSPVWTLGFPAILKGYFDRVWLPGVAFALDDGRVVPTLTNIKKLAAVMTYGAPRTQTFLAGDPPRKVVKRLLRAQIAPRAPVHYLAHYGMDRSTHESRTKFLGKVKTAFSNF